MTTNIELIAACFKDKIPGFTVVKDKAEFAKARGGSDDGWDKAQRLDLDSLHSMFKAHVTSQEENDDVETSDRTEAEKSMELNVRLLSGKAISVQCRAGDSIRKLKAKIQSREGIPADQQRIIFAGRLMEDKSTLSDNNIQHLSTVFVVLCPANSGPKECLVIEDSFLHPEYDFDFTSVEDKVTFYRGGVEYRRPLGWHRLALRVAGHFDDGPRKNDGRGIYSTPNPEVAERYAANFTHAGHTYKLIFQNRVNPATINKVSDGENEYWISSNDRDIRPYSICIKRVAQKRSSIDR